MIKAVIFDCFGVLVTESWIEFKYQHFHHDDNLMQQASDISTQSNAGLISHEEFEKRVAKLANISVASLRTEIDNNPVNKELFKYIAELKKDYKIGMLSNAAANWLKDLFGDDHIALFDETVLSYEAKVIKPDARAYELIAERLGVDTSECIFVDDQERFAIAAKDTGMKGVTYRNVQQVKSEIQSILDNSKS